MCGIFGAVSWGVPFKEEEKTKFNNCLNTLGHRGPDNIDSSVISSKDLGSSFNVFLGHTRLSIIDLDVKSNQPFESDGYQIIFNGEVFNYLELKKELEGEFEFKSNSDTEVILNAYKKYGGSCFGRFNGMWSIVIYDPKKNCILVSRDRFSIKPLYYIEKNDQIFFSSEIRALKGLGFSFSPDQLVMEHFVGQTLLHADNNTFYNEIKRFPAMENWTIDLNSGKTVKEKYWDYSECDFAPDFKGRSEQFRELLIDSLKLRLRSDVPLATLLSGGLDSSAITALIHKHLNPNIQSFSVISNEKKYSEENFIDILAKETGVHNQKLTFNEDLALNSIEKVLGVQEEPFNSLSVVGQYLLFEKIKAEKDITVLLSGQGADEVLLGYNKFFYFHLKDLLKRKKLGKFVGLAGSSFMKGTTIKEFTWKQAKRYMPGKVASGKEYFQRELDKVPIWDFTSMKDRQIKDLNHFSVPALTNYEDRNAMAHQMEIRLPFLDYRLVNFLINIPVEDKLKGGWTKYILRDAVHELPDQIKWRKDKKGFVTPEQKWMQGPLGRKIIDYFSKSSRLEEMGILDRKEFVKAVENFTAGAKWLDFGDIFAVYISEMWLREHV